MHKISNKQDGHQILLDSLNEETQPPSNRNHSNPTTATTTTDSTGMQLGATSRDYGVDDNEHNDNVSGNSKFKINAGIFQSGCRTTGGDINTSAILDSERGEGEWIV